MIINSFLLAAKTTACRRYTVAALLLISLLSGSCSRSSTPEAEHPEEEPIARTEFTDRVLNFFEYEPLKAGKPSQFLIHLTELATGEPIEKAEVTLTIRRAGDGQPNDVKAKVGRVTGIYVAEVAPAERGDYEIEFHIKNEKVDERMRLRDFKVE